MLNPTFVSRDALDPLAHFYIVVVEEEEDAAGVVISLWLVHFGCGVPKFKALRTLGRVGELTLHLKVLVHKGEGQPHLLLLAQAGHAVLAIYAALDGVMSQLWTKNRTQLIGALAFLFR